jgi:hypothetical protein
MQPGNGRIGGAAAPASAFVSIGNIMKHSFSTTFLLTATLLSAAACDSGRVVDHALMHTATLEQTRTTPAPMHDPQPPAYFGDEYADAQRALPDRREPDVPTF